MMPNRQNRVTRDIALVDGRLEGLLENLANRDIDRARAPFLQKASDPAIGPVRPETENPRPAKVWGKW